MQMNKQFLQKVNYAFILINITNKHMQLHYITYALLYNISLQISQTPTAYECIEINICF